jgi:signal transduction histidine kinase
VSVDISQAPTLAALQRARAQREGTVRRVLPVGLAAVAIVAIAAARSTPRPGLHGESLAVLIALVLFPVGAAGAMLARRLGSAARQRHGFQPYHAFLLLLLASSAALVWLQPAGPGVFGLFIAVGTAARLVPGRLGAVLAVAALTFLAVAGLIGNHGHRSAGDLVSMFGLAAVYVAALFSRRVGQQDDQLEQLLIELEQSRGAELRAAALAERQRLAREMHDVLAHSLSGLLLQLEAARLLASEDSADARLTAAIDRAHHLARAGLQEARGAIGMLRDDELPGPAQLAVLTAGFERDTGIRCDLAVSGGERELGSEARLALYRVAQEALTNVRRHARPGRVEVRLGYEPHLARLTVEDFAAAAAGTAAGRAPATDTVPAPRAGRALGNGAGGDVGLAGEAGPGEPAGTGDGGFGLTGMRERAELLGGQLTAGPTGTGFRVELTVPA